MSIIKKVFNGKELLGNAPAKRVFQAIRIETNDELNNLTNALVELGMFLNSGGRMAVISFHSGEDRLVKQAFRYLCLQCTCPPHSPICNCNKRQEATLITKKPITPTEQEIKLNRRAASAHLRVIERI